MGGGGWSRRCWWHGGRGISRWKSRVLRLTLTCHSETASEGTLTAGLRTPPENRHSTNSDTTTENPTLKQSSPAAARTVADSLRMDQAWLLKAQATALLLQAGSSSAG